jgi:hypothetical protein
MQEKKLQSELRSILSIRRRSPDSPYRSDIPSLITPVTTNAVIAPIADLSAIENGNLVGEFRGHRIARQRCTAREVKGRYERQPNKSLTRPTHETF